MNRLASVMDPIGQVTRLSYGLDGRLWRITDPAGRVAKFDHDAAGNLVRIVSPDGGARSFGYDAEHRMVSQTDPRGFVTRYFYDAAGMVRSVEARDGGSRIFRPTNAVGLINLLPPGEGTEDLPMTPLDPQAVFAQITDARGNRTSIHTNLRGQPVRLIDPLGRTQSWEYNQHAEPTQIVSPNGSAVRFTYDNRGNVLTTTRESDGAVTTFTYDIVFDLVKSTEDPLGHVTSFLHDSKGKLLRTTDAAGAISQFTYGPSGLLLSSTDPLGNTSSFAYDSLGNLASVADPLNNVTAFLNDTAGNVTATTDALGRTTRYSYDVMNRLTTVTDALGSITRYTYDAGGNLSSVMDAKGSVTTFSYDSMNRLTASSDPLGRTERYAYDFNGNLSRKTKRDGSTLDYLYDAANQLIRKVTPSPLTGEGTGGGETVYTYDLNGNLAGVSDPDSAVSFSYDPLDRVLWTEATAVGSPNNSVILYTYDPVGNRLTMTANGSQMTTYRYDEMNRLVQLTNPEPQIWNFSYDVAGRRMGLTYPNGIATSYTYDAASRLLSLHHDQGATPVAHFDYAYDPVGNRTAKGELEGSTSYGYDFLNRLTSAATSVPGLPNEFYSYDSVGNRVSSYISNSHLHDAANQLLEDQQFLYSYDHNGNQSGKTAKNGSERWSYTYDAENQLVGAQHFAPAWETTPTMTASYGYDGLGRRITKTVNGVTTTYVYDDKNILEVGGTSVTHGPAIDEALNVGSSSLLHDGIGSVVGEVGGMTVKPLHYESFGRTGQPLTTPYGFAGREIDPETDLYFLRRRFYDPSQGRFTAEDPQLMQWLQLLTLAKAALPQENFQRVQAGIFRLIQQGGIHSTYVYTHNNPILFIDPFGLDPVTWGPPQNTTLPSQLPGGKPGMTPRSPGEPGMEPSTFPPSVDPLFCSMFCSPPAQAGVLVCSVLSGAPYFPPYSAGCFLLCGVF